MVSIKIGIVGATGAVGREFLKLIEERKTPYSDLKLFASKKSAGKSFKFKGKDILIEELKEGCFEGLDLVFFSAGGDVSKKWCPIAVKEGAYAIDNSSAFRMNNEVPLVVPEVNKNLLVKNKPTIIANPNCSTIQLVTALNPLLEYGIESINVSTYQSVSGAGSEGLEELKKTTLAYLNNIEHLEIKKFKKPIAFNNLPEIGNILENGFTDEEMKMVNETKKIFNDNSIKVSSFCVRTPTFNGHSESVWFKLKSNISLEEIKSKLKVSQGVKLIEKGYMTNDESTGKNEVYISRLRKDLENDKTYTMWVVADNIRKGAALNGLQIAESLFSV